MQRLVDMLQSDDFLAAHPAVQAAYVHHYCVKVHPFPDGNGRVARALASVFTYRSHYVPALIFASDKRKYLSAIRAADAGNTRAYCRLIQSATESAVDLFVNAVEAAKREDSSASVAA